MFGASGATGRALVAEALRRSHAVRALARPEASWRPPAGVALIRGSLDDPEAIGAALEGAEVALCVFGPRPPFGDIFCERATARIREAMRARGILRLICQTGSMIGEDLRPLTWPMRIMAGAFRRQRPEGAADRARQERVVMESGLEWTLVKPPRLTDGPLTGRVRVGPDLRVGLMSAVSRADLAQVLLDLAETRAHLRERVYVVGV